MSKIETAKTADGTEVEFRVRWTTVYGERGVVWEWRENAEGQWSEPNGPMATKAEAREWALETIASF